MEQINIEQLVKTKKVLEDIARKIIEQVPQSARPSSIKFTFDLNTLNIIFELDVVAASIVFGSKPHFPPINAIRGWVERKGIKPRADSNGKLPTIGQLSFLIARKISRVGTPSHIQFYSEPAEQIINMFQTQLEQAFAEDFMDMMGLNDLC